MSKLTKHAEILNQMHKMVLKKADAQQGITGKPGGDTHQESVPAEHDHIDKNKVVPEHNSGGDGKTQQGFTQKPSDKPAEPAANAKKASELGSEILDEIKKNAEEAQKGHTGKPGDDMKQESISEKTEHIDKVTIGPEHSNRMDGTKGQGYTQEKQPDAKDAPAKNAKKAADEESKKDEAKTSDVPEPKVKKEDKEVEKEEEAVKVASYELGRQLAIGLLKKQAAAQPSPELLKEAGRRDFDIIINQIAEKLGYNNEQVKTAEEFDAEQIKQAEEAGAAYCDELMKQAAVEEVLKENEALKAKIAEVEASKNKEASAKEKAEDMAKIAELVTQNVIAALKKDVEPSK